MKKTIRFPLPFGDKHRSFGRHFLCACVLITALGLMSASNVHATPPDRSTERAYQLAVQIEGEWKYYPHDSEIVLPPTTKKINVFWAAPPSLGGGFQVVHARAFQHTQSSLYLFQNHGIGIFLNPEEGEYRSDSDSGSSDEFDQFHLEERPPSKKDSPPVFRKFKRWHDGVYWFYYLDSKNFVKQSIIASKQKNFPPEKSDGRNEYLLRLKPGRDRLSWVRIQMSFQTGSDIIRLGIFYCPEAAGDLYSFTLKRG